MKTNEDFYKKRRWKTRIRVNPELVKKLLAACERPAPQVGTDDSSCDQNSKKEAFLALARYMDSIQKDRVAYGLRWMATNLKYPFPVTDRPGYHWMWVKYSAYCKIEGDTTTARACRIAPFIFERLMPPRLKVAAYKTWLHAVEALAQAIFSLCRDLAIDNEMEETQPSEHLVLPSDSDQEASLTGHEFGEEEE